MASFIVRSIRQLPDIYLPRARQYLRQTVVEMSPAHRASRKERAVELELGAGKQTHIDVTVHPVLGEARKKAALLSNLPVACGRGETDIPNGNRTFAIFPAAMEFSMPC